MYVCMYVCMCTELSINIQLNQVKKCACVCVCICMYVCFIADFLNHHSAKINTFMYVCTSSECAVTVCMYVCMYVCIFTLWGSDEVQTYIHTYIHTVTAHSDEVQTYIHTYIHTVTAHSDEVHTVEICCDQCTNCLLNYHTQKLKRICMYFRSVGDELLKIDDLPRAAIDVCQLRAKLSHTKTNT
jgi:hypothetical protein